MGGGGGWEVEISGSGLEGSSVCSFSNRSDGRSDWKTKDKLFPSSPIHFVLSPGGEDAKGRIKLFSNPGPERSGRKEIILFFFFSQQLPPSSSPLVA